jgi:hypothetical protein
MGKKVSEIAQPENRRKNRRGKKEIHPAMVRYQFKPGHSGNPGGRPRKLTNMLDQLLATRRPGDKRHRTYAQALIEAALNRAIAKSDVLAKEIFDRIEGRVGPVENDIQRQPGVRVIVLDVPRPDRSAIGRPPTPGGTV